MRPLYKDLRDIMADGQPHTLEELSETLDAHSPTVSATLRMYRRQGEIVNKHYDKRRGKWLYAMPSAEPKMPTPEEMQEISQRIVADVLQKILAGMVRH